MVSGEGLWVHQARVCSVPWGCQQCWTFVKAGLLLETPQLSVGLGYRVQESGEDSTGEAGDTVQQTLGCLGHQCEECGYCLLSLWS